MMKKKILFVTLILLLALTKAYGQNFSPLMPAGDLTGLSYSDEYYADYYPGGYFYHGFTIATEADVTISHCGSEVNETYLTLYDGNGRFITNGSYDNHECSGERAYLKRTSLPAGDYYVASYFNYGGYITVNISCSPVQNPTGNKMTNAINVGNISAAFNYSDTRNTNYFTNDYQGRTTKDVFYKFTLTTAMDIIVSHCGSDVSDTYVSLLNSGGGLITFNDNNSNPGACNDTSQAWLKVENLAPGTYYVVSEGYSTNGIITTNIEGRIAFRAPDLSSNRNYVFTVTPTIATNEAESLGSGESMQSAQYIDGLGYPTQTVRIGAAPDNADLVNYQEYDNYGRESKNWLPAVVAGNNGAFVPYATFVNKSSASYTNDPKAYSQTVYENSPLNRILEHYGPGQDWHNNSKAVKTTYLTNNGTQPCKLYTTSDDKQTVSVAQASSATNYAEGELYVIRTTDEDGNISYAFKDKLGQVVLTRQMEGTTAHDTYYIYDSFGNLRVVLPPLAADNLTSGTWNESNTQLQQYAYLYKYDGRNRCIAKKLPGAEWNYYIYDKADRLIFSQDGAQRTRSEWTFNIPDAHGRTTLTGTCTNQLNHTAQLSSVVSATWANVTNVYKGYNVSGITLSGMKILAADYYDSYDFMGKNDVPAATNGDFIYETVASYGTRYTEGYQGLHTGSLATVLDEAGTITYLPTVMYYDQRGRMIQAKSKNHLSGGIEKEYLAYTFTGQPKLRKHVHSATGKTTQTEFYTYTYDHAERLTKTEHQLQAGSTLNSKVTLAEYTYDALGRLATKKPHGSTTNPVTYAYNIRNWLTGIASNRFTQNLYYNTGSGAARYNGNISSMTWKGGTESTLRGYKFTYDGLDRLNNAVYGEGTTITGTNRFGETPTYDKHGNITQFVRMNNGTSATLAMQYTGNQLTRKGTSAYAYDANGNMTTDNSKNISNIQYNILNLPKQVQFSSGGVANYVYDAAGVKRQVKHQGAGVSQTTDYCGNVIYENGMLSRILTEEGYITLSGTTPTYHYYLKDHLGNNRVVLNQDGTTVEQVNHYYPFGGVFDQTAEATQPYKYNGKELDRTYGLDLYDYSARYMDGAIGRFTTMDPLAEKYYGVSPYAYCAGNPVKYIDPNGKEIVFVVSVGGKTQNLKYTTQGTLQDSKGRTVNVPTDSHAGQILDGYNKMLDSGDANYVKQVTTLIRSNNVHEINTRLKSNSGGEVTSGSGPEEISVAEVKARNGEGIGTTTMYNFSEKTLKNGLKKSNYTTVAHEVQHQYDFDQGNMKDNYGKKGEKIDGSINPAETRAISNEDKAREQEKFDKRQNY